MADKIHYLSKESLEALKKEYDDVKYNQIPAVANKINEAKQQGDLSENAEYHQAKEEMAWAQGRLLELDTIINNAQIIEKEKTGGKIEIGSTVKIKINNTEKTYQIVGAQEADPLNGKISNESPLGNAFLGHKAGDKVEVRTPAGLQNYEIKEVI
ncbi:MAG TPA: transcription elongation factor GreA [Candidatus Magasanikbacteria bacterium]|nr:transcription elongation factor GreA [Candidatus Magasanikbacteria bacterium]